MEEMEDDEIDIIDDDSLADSSVAGSASDADTSATTGVKVEGEGEAVLLQTAINQ